MMLLRLFALLFIINTSNLFCQNITGVVKDSLTDTILPYVNITFLKKDKGAYTDDKGKFEIDITNHLNDSLFITCIGYQSKKIAVKSIENFYIDVSLQSVSEIIDEVVLSTNKQKFGSKIIKIGSKKKGVFSLSAPFGSKIAYLLKNPKKTYGKLKEVTIYTKDNKTSKIPVYQAYFRLNFYKYDTVVNKPGKLLTLKNFLMKPQKGSKKITIDLEGESIVFPKEGVYLVIEILSAGKQPKNKLYTISPLLIYTHSKESNTWGSYRGKKWKKKSLTSVFKSEFYSNLLVNTKVYY